MPEDAVLEAPAELEAPLLEGTESTESTETAEAEPSSEQQTTEQTEAESKLPLVKQAQPALDKIKAENPGLAAKIKDALWRDQQLAKDLPEGIKGAVALRTEVAGLAAALNDPTYQGAAPAQILADVKSQLGYFHELDALFTSGSPEFANKMADASPEAFQKIAVPVFQKFAETNPDGYSAYVSRAVDSFFEAGGMTVEFEMLKAFLPQLAEGAAKDRVIASFEKIYGMNQKLKEFAKAPIAPASKKEDTAAQLQTQREELAQQQLNVTRQTWNSAHTKYGADLIASETTRLAGKTALTDQQKTSIRAKVAEEINARLEAKREYGQAMRTFLQNGDQDGYRRRLHSEYKNLIPGATSRAYSDVIAGAKPGPKAVVKAAAPVSGAAKANPADAGYRTVTKYPVGQVDLNKTRGKDLEAGRLTLKDGSKVLFKRGSSI